MNHQKSNWCVAVAISVQRGVIGGGGGGGAVFE